MKKHLNTKNIHLLIIAAGMIFTIVSLFHTNLWFDESYSVSLASHSFSEIWRIDSYDVHPVFYYDCLHVLYLLFGSNVIVYRLFSWACLCALGIFGYTGIRRDYGENVGLLFSFFVFFFPLNVVYAGEVRMYMLAMLLVTKGVFYAARLAKGQLTIANSAFMVLYFVLAAYTHYYGLLAAAVVNLILLVLLIVRWRKTKKVDVLTWIIDAVLQIGAYLPWVFVLLSQIGQVKQDYWIHWYWPSSLFETLLYQISGNIDKTVYVPTVLTAIFEAALVIYLLFNARHHLKEHNSSHLLTLGTYTGVIAAAVIAGKVLGRLIFYERYLMVCTGLLLFYIAYSFAHWGRQILTSIFCVCMVILSLFANVSLISTNYDASNTSPYEYIDQYIQDGDAILVSNDGQDPNSFIAVAHYLGHPVYYWNENKWMDSSVAAYQAFSTDMTVFTDISAMKGFHGRLWVIYADDDGHGSAVNRTYQITCEVLGVTIGKTEYFKTNYKNIEYTIGLIEA